MNRGGVAIAEWNAGRGGRRAAGCLCAVLLAATATAPAQEAAVRDVPAASAIAWPAHPAYVESVAASRSADGVHDVLAIRVADPPAGARLCVEWLDDDASIVREDCQALRPGAGDTRFVSPALVAQGEDFVARVRAETPLPTLAEGTPQMARSMGMVAYRGASPNPSAPRYAPPRAMSPPRYARRPVPSPPPPPPPAASAPPPTASAAFPPDPAKPKGFPWPPPDPTSRATLDRTMVENRADETLGGAAKKLQAALESVGYLERSYYPVPGGFALVTRLEQIDARGKPVSEPGRWSMTTAPRKLFSPADFLRVLFTAPEGNYRVIAFVVSNQPFRTEDEDVTAHDASDWLDAGLDRLPPALARQPLDADHGCTALIYQFRKIADDDPVANPDDAPPALSQLSNSGILAALAR